MEFTSSLVLWLIWCLSKNMRPLNILSVIVGRITLLVFIKSLFSLQFPAYAIRSTDRAKKCKNTDTVHLKKHLYYPYSCSSQVCAWTIGCSSDFRSTLDSWGTSWKKTRIWHPQLQSVLQLYLLELLSLKDTAAGLQEDCVVREQKAELFIHVSVLIKMHQYCSGLSLHYQ